MVRNFKRQIEGMDWPMARIQYDNGLAPGPNTEESRDESESNIAQDGDNGVAEIAAHQQSAPTRNVYKKRFRLPVELWCPTDIEPEIF